MPDELDASDAYDKARDTVEAALDAHAKKDDAKGDKLMQQAHNLDPDAVQDAFDDLKGDTKAEPEPK